jgi:hypothetical protein
MSKITTDTEVRLSYTSVLEPKAQDSEKPDVLTYSTAILIPKSDTATVDAIRAAVKEALADGVAKKWNGKTPPNLKNPLRDGDLPKANGDDPDEAYKDHWFLNAKGPRGGAEAPILLGKNGLPTHEYAVVYSGVYGRVSLQFYPFDKSGNKGVACSIMSFLSGEHGDALGAPPLTAASAAADFGVATPASEFDTPASTPAASEPEASASDDDVWGS